MWTTHSSYWVTHSLLLWKKRLSLNVFKARFRFCTKFIPFPSNYSKESKGLDWCSIWNWIADVLPGFSEYPLFFFSPRKLVFLPDLTESPLGIMRKLLQGAITAAKGLLNPRFDGLRIRQEDSKRMKRKLHILKKTKSICIPVSGWKREKKKWKCILIHHRLYCSSMVHNSLRPPFPFPLHTVGFTAHYAMF